MPELLMLEGKEREFITIMDNENLLGVYYSELELIHFVWKQRTLGDPYRQSFIDAIEFSKTHPTKYFLSDIRLQGIVGPEDRKWFETVALASAKEQGMQRSALIFDGNVFKMYYINMILKDSTSKGMAMKFFKELDKAAEWLLSE